MTAPHWIEILNGSVFFVETSIGLKIPLISFLLGIVIFIASFLLIIQDFRAAKKIERQLEQVTSGLKSLKSPSNQVNQDMLDNIQALFKQDGILKSIQECWEEFYETLLPEAREGDLYYTNTFQAETFFKGEFVFHELPSLTLSLPGLATGIGLLGTFLALLFGLAELHVSQSGAVSGIGGFINALSGKFFSSIIGLTAALTITGYINQFRKRMLNHKLYALQHELNVLFPRKSTELILMDLKKEVMKVNNTVGHVANDLSQNLPQALRDSLSGDLQGLLTAINNLGYATEALKEVSSSQVTHALDAVNSIRDGIERLQTQNSEALTDSFRSMLDDFRQSLHQSASGEMQQLSQNLGHAAQFLNDMQINGEAERERQAIADERLNQLIDAMQKAGQNQGEQMNAGTERMQALLEQVAEQARQVNQNGRQSLQEQLETLLVETRRQSEEGRRQMHELIEHAFSQFQSGSQTHMDELMRQSESMVGRMDTLLTRLDEMGVQQQNQTQKALTVMQTQLTDAANLHGDTMNRQQTAMSEAIGESLNRLTSFMEEREHALQQGHIRLNQAQQALAETLNSGNDALSGTIEGLKAAVGQSLESMQYLTNSQKVLGTLTQEIQENQRTFTGGLSQAQQTANTYEKAVLTLHKAVETQAERIKQLEDGLTTVLNTIHENLERYTRTMNDGQRNSLENWDRIFSEAANTFATITDGVKESVEGMTDALDSVSDRLVATQAQ